MKKRNLLLALLILVNVALLFTLGYFVYGSNPDSDVQKDELAKYKDEYQAAKEEREIYSDKYSVVNDQLKEVKTENDKIKKEIKKREKKADKQVADYLESSENISKMKAAYTNKIKGAPVPDKKRLVNTDGLFELVDNFKISSAAQAQQALSEKMPQAGGVNAFELVSENDDGSYTFKFMFSGEALKNAYYTCTINQDGEITKLQAYGQASEDSESENKTEEEEDKKLTEQEAIEAAINYHNSLNRPAATLSESKANNEGGFVITYIDKDLKSYVYTVSADGKVKE